MCVKKVSLVKRLGWMTVKGALGILILRGWWTEPLWGFRITKRELQTAPRSVITVPFLSLWFAPGFLVMAPVVGLACVWDALVDFKEINFE